MSVAELGREIDVPANTVRVTARRHPRQFFLDDKTVSLVQGRYAG